MDMFESLSGHRFTHNYMRPGGVVHDFPRGWMQQCEAWMDNFEKVSIPELHESADRRTKSLMRARRVSATLIHSRRWPMG